MSSTIWTIGYEGHDPETFVSALRKAKIERLVDIRELPLSRKSGFSKSALALGVRKAGMEYSHVKALGTPRVVRHSYKTGGSFDEFRDAYLEHLETVPAAVRELEEIARKERCALMCVEHEAEACHRSVLAGVLAERGWTIVHL